MNLVKEERSHLWKIKTGWLSRNLSSQGRSGHDQIENKSQSCDVLGSKICLPGFHNDFTCFFARDKHQVKTTTHVIFASNQLSDPLDQKKKLKRKNHNIIYTYI